MAALAVTAGPASARADGVIRICRYPPRAIGVSDRKHIPIPADSTFVSADDPKTGDQLKPFFIVRTTRDVVLPPKPGCVTAPVEFEQNPEHYTVTTRYPQPLQAQFNVVGTSLGGRVVSAIAP